MSNYFLLLALPILLALITGLCNRIVKRAPHLFTGILAIFYMLASAVLVHLVSRTETANVSIPWVAELGMNIDLRITSFSAWFGALIFAIGASILTYASSYFSKHKNLPFLLICLLLFTSAMLGVIWSDNFYLLFLFWEATSLISFLLVGFHHEKEESRTKASQALLITLIGGACLLTGFIIIHQLTGINTISVLIEHDLGSSTLSNLALILIVIGCFTKSAQFPFHFWLPNAMAGPTPVSAYLHSATMVKAGVYLLAILAPVFVDHTLWTYMLTTAGLLTIFISVKRAWYESDMKAILASTTLAALGFLTVLAGIGSPKALVAFVVVLTAHALYKAPLFLSAGNLEKQFGTRNIHQLNGTIHRSPITGAVILVSIFSLLGVPPFAGFLAKEYFLKAVWEHSMVLTIFSTLAATGVICIGFRLLRPLFSKDHMPAMKTPLPRAMALATLWPTLIVLGLLALHPIVNKLLYIPATETISAEKSYGFSYWHGWTPALGLGLGALAIGFCITLSTTHKESSQNTVSGLEKLYNLAIKILLAVGKLFGRLLEKETLTNHLSVILIVIGALSVSSIELGNWPSLERFSSTPSTIFIILAPVIAVATIVAARTTQALTILVSLGFVGLLIAFIFLWFSAPDLALTQLLAETLIIFLITGVLLKAKPTNTSKTSSPIRFFIAAGATVLVTLLILKSMALEWDSPISSYYVTHSKSSAFGANVVNVILVDFRALDTLGEIVVLAIAAIGASSALGAARRRTPLPGSLNTEWISSSFPILVTVLIPAALWIFWRGHNAPGGGFIAALLIATAIGFGILIARPELHPKKLRKTSRNLLVTGLAIATASSLLPVLVGKPFFTGLWWHYKSLHLGTPLLFDLGVLLTVIGFALSYLRHFHSNSTLQCKS